MHQAGAMRSVQAAKHIGHHSGGLLRRHRSVRGDPIGQVAAGHPVEGDPGQLHAAGVVGSPVPHGDDVRMVQAGHALALAQEGRSDGGIAAERGVQHLDRDLGARCVQQIGRGVDRGRAADPQGTLHLVSPADQRGHHRIRAEYDVATAATLST